MNAQFTTSSYVDEMPGAEVSDRVGMLVDQARLRALVSILATSGSSNGLTLEAPLVLNRGGEG